MAVISETLMKRMEMKLRGYTYFFNYITVFWSGMYIIFASFGMIASQRPWPCYADDEQQYVLSKLPHG
jgi:hypothetical protein